MPLINLGIARLKDSCSISVLSLSLLLRLLFSHFLFIECCSVFQPRQVNYEFWRVRADISSNEKRHHNFIELGVQISNVLCHKDNNINKRFQIATTAFFVLSFPSHYITSPRIKPRGKNRNPSIMSYSCSLLYLPNNFTDCRSCPSEWCRYHKSRLVSDPS